MKVVNPDLASDPAMVDRFGKEARAAARANHDNLTHIYFVGQTGGRPFFAMEYVPGENLEDRVARTGPLPLAEAVDVLVQAARGLAAAHAVGVVHRDVKPSNVILLPDGRVKVTDFGLAKSGGGDPTASAVGQLTGTPGYMSPEQCRADAVDARSDVYSLGLTAWFLLGGRPAYAAQSVVAVLGDQMHTPLPPLSALRPELPPPWTWSSGASARRTPRRAPRPWTRSPASSRASARGRSASRPSRPAAPRSPSTCSSRPWWRPRCRSWGPTSTRT